MCILGLPGALWKIDQDTQTTSWTFYLLEPIILLIWVEQMQNFSKMCWNVKVLLNKQRPKRLYLQKGAEAEVSKMLK